MRRRRRSEGFNLAFLDIMSCGLGAIVLVFMLVKYNVSDSNAEANNLIGEVQLLESQQVELQQTLDQLRNTSQSEAEKIANLKAKLAQIKQKLSKKESSLANKKGKLAALKKDIVTRPIAHKDDLIEDDQGGECLHHPFRRFEGRQDYRGHLNEQPRHNRVGHAYPEDVSALEFGDQCHLARPG